MLLDLLFFFFSFFHWINSLHCYDNCSMTYSIDQHFQMPSNCHLISTNRCSVKFIFWYGRNEYILTFPGEILNDPYLSDNQQFLMIETARKKFFSYDINYNCKGEDNCAQKYAQKKIQQMSRTIPPLDKLYEDLEPILHRPRSLPSNDLACFDTNEAVRQCALEGLIGSCQIVDDLVKRKVHRRSCQRSSHESASVNIYDSGSFAMMTVKCNRMLCNGPLTVEAVKKVLRNYNITDINGRLPDKSSRVSSMSLLVFLILSFFLITA